MTLRYRRRSGDDAHIFLARPGTQESWRGQVLQRLLLFLGMGSFFCRLLLLDLSEETSFGLRRVPSALVRGAVGGNADVGDTCAVEVGLWEFSLDTWASGHHERDLLR